MTPEHQGGGTKRLKMGVVLLLAAIAAVMAFSERGQVLTASHHTGSDGGRTASPSLLSTTTATTAATRDSAAAPDEAAQGPPIVATTRPPTSPPPMTAAPAPRTTAPHEESAAESAPFGPSPSTQDVSWLATLPSLSACRNWTNGAAAPAPGSPSAINLVNTSGGSAPFISCGVVYLLNTTIVNLCNRQRRCVAVFSTSGVLEEPALGPQRVASAMRAAAFHAAKHPSAVAVEPSLRAMLDESARGALVSGEATLQLSNRVAHAASRLLGTHFAPPSPRAATARAPTHTDWAPPTLLLLQEVPLHATVPLAQLPKPVMYFDSAILMQEPSCLTNLWHGMFQNVLPLFDALVRSGVIGPLHGVAPFRQSSHIGESPEADAGHRPQPWQRVAFVFDMPQRDSWAAWNHGCQSRNSWPYGLSVTNWVGRMMLHVMNVDISRYIRNVDSGEPGVPTDLQPEGGAPLNGNIFFNNEVRAPHGGAMNPWVGTLRVLGRAVVGLPKTCEPFNPGSLDPSLGRQGHVRWPYYGDVGQNKEGAYCAELVDRLRQLLVQKEQLAKATGIPDVPISARERRCPRVLFVLRPANASGRVITNDDEVRDALRRTLAANCPDQTFTLQAIRLERFSITEQLRLVYNSTVVVAARGAGTVAILFQRQGAGFLSLSIADRRAPVHRDQYPWYPMATLMRRRHAVIINCDAIVDRVRVTNANCLTVSTNFCDMSCGTGAVVRAMDRLLALMRHGLKTSDAPPPNFEGIAPPVVVRNDGLEYFASEE